MVSNNKKEIELSRTDILDKLEERLEKRIEKNPKEDKYKHW